MCRAFLSVLFTTSMRVELGRGGLSATRTHNAPTHAPTHAPVCPQTAPLDLVALLPTSSTRARATHPPAPLSPLRPRRCSVYYPLGAALRQHARLDLRRWAAAGGGPRRAAAAAAGADARRGDAERGVAERPRLSLLRPRVAHIKERTREKVGFSSHFLPE